MIDARNASNMTGIKVSAGNRYAIQIRDVIEPIVDGDGRLAVKCAGLEGWDCVLLWPLFYMKRDPLEPYFALMATVEGEPVGRILEFDPLLPSKTLFSPSRSGLLECYFNDWSCRYSNNHGRFRIEFTELSLRPPPKCKMR